MHKILIVDDELDMELLFRQKFKREIREGFIDFCFVLSGEEALNYLERAEGTEVVIILSDINMPGISGIELLRQLKARFPHLVVFMITAYDDDEKREKALSLGADDYLPKPIDFTRLKAAIQNILTTLEQS